MYLLKDWMEKKYKTGSFIFHNFLRASLTETVENDTLKKKTAEDRNKKTENSA